MTFGFTTERPIVPDQFTHRVVVAATDEVDAQILAAQIVSCGKTMVTSTTIVDFWV